MNTTTAEPKTKVVFRIYRAKHNHEVIALFPQIAEDRNGYQCSAYVHNGQHTAADPMAVISQTRVAKPAEYAHLKRELERIGYNLTLASKCTRQDFEIRKATAQPQQQPA